MEWFTINIGRLGCPIQVQRFGKKVGRDWPGMREAKGVGGTSVLLVPGRVKGRSGNSPACWDRSIDKFVNCFLWRTNLKIHILIETVWNGFCYKPEQFRDYIDAINSPWVQAYYDIGNMQKYGPSHKWIRDIRKTNP